MNIKTLIWPLLILLYALLLSVNLLSLPLYLDEGIYIFYSYLFSTDPSFAYVSMQEGKTPLFFWATTFLNQLVDNFLLSARLVSVIASTITLVCFLIICGKLFGKKGVLILYILFIVSPFNILTSRMAFVDSLMIAFGSLSILMVFLLRQTSEKNQILKSLALGVFSGIFLFLAFMTKTPGKIFLIAQIILLAFLIFEEVKNKHYKTASLILITGLITAGVYFELQGYLRIGAYRFWEMISGKESSLAFTLPEIFKNLFPVPNSIYFKNLQIVFEYFYFYFSTLVILFLLGVFYIIKSKKNFRILFLVIFLFGAVFLSSKLPASRYFAIIVPSFLLVSSAGFLWMWESRFKYLKILAVTFLLIPTFFSAKIIYDPANASYHPEDGAGFVDYNLNALGLKESVEMLEPKKETAAVGVTGIWGVAEGANVAFKEKGIEAYTLGKVITSSLKTDEPCEKDYRELGGKCWRIDFGDLVRSKKPEKFVYLVTEEINMDSLKQLTGFEVVEEFVRPKTNLNVYLIKLH